MKTFSFEPILTPKTFNDLFDLSKLGSKGVSRLLNLFQGDLNRILELDDFLEVVDNQRISQEITNFCQMVPIPF